MKRGKREGGKEGGKGKEEVDQTERMEAPYQSCQ